MDVNILKHIKLIKNICIFLVICIVGWYTIIAQYEIINAQLDNINKSLIEKNPIYFEKCVYPDTLIIYKGKKYRYSETRENFLQTVHNKSFQLTGHGLKSYELDPEVGIFYANVPLWAFINGPKDSKLELNITANFKRTWSLGWKLESLDSDNNFFGYLFIDKNIDPQFHNFSGSI